MTKNIFSIVVALGGGITVGSAAAAFITLLQIVPRLIQFTETEEYVKLYQYVTVSGFVLFSFLYFSNFHIGLNKIFVGLIGLVFGIFIGLFSSALAEVLNVVPVLSKKFKIKDRLKYVIGALILGKVTGSLYYWLIFKKH
ncbi:stage V sporulation protein AB [Tissierella sp. MSJ-40]|uniref:Stage V sporulation protein AB n=1 Tax=Tissierella simiarum TaxID=2841534 RepID=A0ABS6E5M8_9FIRM|nr:stage V sporulation protein AB [Tissierella simiarum]MBU5438225.1 stage V sporulation protein AB [Tissierella simiarum]